jgi:hypothetical protein
VRGADRPNHVPLDQVLPLRTIHLLDDRAGERSAVVRVRRHFARLAHTPRPVASEESVERQNIVGLCGEQHPEHAILEARRMRHQIANADRLFEALVRDLELGRQVTVHGRVEIDLAGLDRAHHLDPRERLRDRADPKQRGRRIDSAQRRERREAVALLEHDPAVLDDRDRRAGDVLVVHRELHGRIHERLELWGRYGLLGRQAGSRALREGRRHRRLRSRRELGRRLGARGAEHREQRERERATHARQARQ